MSKRWTCLFLTLALIAGVLAVGVAAATAGITEQERTAAIDAGLAWLNAHQTGTGYFEDPDHPGYWPVALTALAVLKFEDDAARNDLSPFDAEYKYSPAVQSAWQYLSKNAHVQKLTAQPAGNPDTNQNGIGVCFFSPGNNTCEVYETSAVMMALQASRKSGMVIPGGTGTFYDVLQDCVDWVAWAQTDGGTGEGGWYYRAMDNTSGTSDNSNSPWPVLGLMAAEAWGISPPPWVKSELQGHWLVATQQTNTMPKPGAFGYTTALNSTACGFFATTAAGMVELSYCGVNSTAPQWLAGASAICREWGTWNIGNLYAMYGLMKAAMLALPTPVWTFCEHEWQPEYDRWLVDHQTKNGENAGSWPAHLAVPCIDGTGNAVLSTEFALLVLQKAVPDRYDPLASFEDLLRRQAERLESFESLLKAAWDRLGREHQLEFLRSFEDLLGSQAERLESFEDLLSAAMGELDWLHQLTFLRSFEDLLRRQAQALASFEDLLKAYNAAVQPALQILIEEE